MPPDEDTVTGGLRSELVPSRFTVATNFAALNAVLVSGGKCLHQMFRLPGEKWCLP
jgi:hypothetical protein